MNSGDSDVGFRRRIAAASYDALALIALMFFATMPVVIYLDGQAIAAENPFYTLYLFTCGYFYFGICWTRSGQSLGMSAWKIRVVTERGTRLDWRTAFVRYVAALLSWLVLGLGFLSALFRSDRKTWHDLLSHTRLVRQN